VGERVADLLEALRENGVMGLTRLRQGICACGFESGASPAYSGAGPVMLGTAFVMAGVADGVETVTACPSEIPAA
jgi:hypothetical protein